MEEENKGVPEETPTGEVKTPAKPEENNEQVKKPLGGETPETDGKDYKAIAQQLSKDIQSKNQKIQELKNNPPAPVKEEQKPPVDEGVKRFEDTEKRSLKAEANSEILMKLQTDPSFKERMNIVIDYVAKGHDIETADKFAKSDIMDKILKELPQEVQEVNKPKQIDTQATPEDPTFQKSGDPVKDILDDPEAPEAAKEAVRRYFPQ